MNRSAALALAAALAACLGAPPARADVAPPHPEDCLPGTRGRSNHYGAYCEPDDCTEDSQCRPGEVCAHLPLCVTRKVFKSDRGNTREARAGALCDPANPRACDSEASCEAGPICVPRRYLTEGQALPRGSKLPPLWRGPSACSCDVPAAAGPAGASLAALAVAAAAVRRRRRAPR
jgi:MYXO-CTERM domain-containing protein